MTGAACAVPDQMRGARPMTVAVRRAAYLFELPERFRRACRRASYRIVRADAESLRNGLCHSNYASPNALSDEGLRQFDGDSMPLGNFIRMVKHERFT